MTERDGKVILKEARDRTNQFFANQEAEAEAKALKAAEGIMEGLESRIITAAEGGKASVIVMSLGDKAALENLGQEGLNLFDRTSPFNRETFDQVLKLCKNKKFDPVLQNLDYRHLNRYYKLDVIKVSW